MAVRILKNSEKVDGVEQKFSEQQLGEIEASKRYLRLNHYWKADFH